jgi:hypothetical protein
MGDRPKGMTLDRIDNEADYAPENCRWATQKEQSNNRRSSVFLTIGDTTQTAMEWADETGVSCMLIYARKKMGWSDQDCIYRKVK